VAYVKFLTASRQTAVVDTLRWRSRRPMTANPPQRRSNTVPSPRRDIPEILPAAFKARLFKCFLDAAVSEQIFRRVAIGGHRNAGDMISNLSRVYNRARQSQITSELSEIIGGRLLK
jgi:F-type H+-transporting ATPase subunit gamma